MLKSTYTKHATPASASETLPAGWTEHKAPTGHTYYYNAETKQSTYTRPVEVAEQEELSIDYGATQPDHVMRASLNVMEEFHKNNTQSDAGHFTGGKSYQDRSRPNRQGDRPKTRVSIPKGAPWILVKTKYGRRFVHNTETKESLWKFPSEVMMAVIDMDRADWEAKKQAEERKEAIATAVAEAETKKHVDAANKSGPSDQPQANDFYDSDSYEEVEVTDDENEDVETSLKRQRLDDGPTKPAGPVEFDEDDIAFQLAVMEQDDEDPGYDEHDPDDYISDDGEEGLELTTEDVLALFRSLLDEHRVSPFTTFDSLIDTNTALANAIVADDRWTALPNMSSRRRAFDDWSRDRAAEQKARDANAVKTKKLDPRITYLRFLSENATPKLYWPEFKRKFRKEAEMKDAHFPDRDREKLYREYIVKLKLSDSDRRKELVALLKSVALNEQWNRDTTLNTLPETVERDLRFYLVPAKQRDEMVEVHIGTLPKR